MGEKILRVMCSNGHTCGDQANRLNYIHDKKKPGGYCCFHFNSLDIFCIVKGAFNHSPNDLTFQNSNFTSNPDVRHV